MSARSGGFHPCEVRRSAMSARVQLHYSPPRGDILAVAIRFLSARDYGLMSRVVRILTNGQYFRISETGETLPVFHA